MATSTGTLAGLSDITAKLEVIDVHKEPERALDERIFVTPTLVRLAPKPERRVTGNLNDKTALLLLLGVTAR